MRSVQDLTPEELENLTFDMLVAIGFSNLIWRTPGADGGRDIEGTYTAKDVSGGLDVQKWYVECKRYGTSIDWPTVWKKIAYADSHEASYFLLATNSNPSPNCETEISRWNNGRHSTKVRFWRGYDVERLLQQIPSVAVKYGLMPKHSTEVFGFIGIAGQIMKIVQATHVAHSLGQQQLPGLEAAAALSELFSMRMEDVQRYGRMVSHPVDKDLDSYDWLSSNEFNHDVPSVIIRALVATFRYLTNSAEVSISSRNDCLIVRAIKPKISIGDAASEVLKEIALWCNMELASASFNNENLIFRLRNGT